MPRRSGHRSGSDWALAFLLIAVLSFALAASSRSETVSPTTNILFAGNFVPYLVDNEQFLKDLDLIPRDLFIYSGSTLEESSKRALEDSGLATSSLWVPSHANAGNGVGRSSISIVNDVLVVSLDTSASSSEGYQCELATDQLEFLSGAVEDSTRHTVLVMDHDIWSIDASGTPRYPCWYAYWTETILPLISGEVDVVLSSRRGGSERFAIEEVGGILYVEAGMPDRAEGVPAALTFARLRFTNGQVAVMPTTFRAPGTVDESALASVPVFEVAVDEQILREVFEASPIYAHGINWPLMIETAEVIEEIKTPLPGTLLTESGPFEVELSVRGNVGNHWRSFKKSWSVDFSDGESRQLKFVLPDNRAYVSQMFVVEVSHHLGVLSPEIDVGRLVVNGHDFGVFLVYEDIDRIFLELNKYSADTRLAKNRFRDHFDVYPVTEALGNVVVGSGRGDKTEQQMVADADITPENINLIFDQDAFARWLAVSVFVGDTHQDVTDNFRFFLDRSTGLYVVIGWDASLGIVNPDEPLRWKKGLLTVFLANPENAELVRHYVGQLVADAPELRLELEDLIDEFSAVFENDPALPHAPGVADTVMQRLLSRFDTNLISLSGYVDG